MLDQPLSSLLRSLVVPALVSAVARDRAMTWRCACFALGRRPRTSELALAIERRAGAGRYAVGGSPRWPLSPRCRGGARSDVCRPRAARYRLGVPRRGSVGACSLALPRARHGPSLACAGLLALQPPRDLSLRTPLARIARPSSVWCSGRSVLLSWRTWSSSSLLRSAVSFLFFRVVLLYGLEGARSSVPRERLRCALTAFAIFAVFGVTRPAIRARSSAARRSPFVVARFLAGFTRRSRPPRVGSRVSLGYDVAPPGTSRRSISVRSVFCSTPTARTLAGRSCGALRCHPRSCVGFLVVARSR